MDANGRTARQIEYPTGVDVYIVSYQQVLAWKHSFTRLFLNPHTFILDEAMNVKGGQKTHALIREISKDAERVIAMTANPVREQPARDIRGARGDRGAGPVAAASLRV
jgi:hypothetical protein